MVIKVMSNMGNKKSQPSFEMNYTKATPKNLKKGAELMIASTGLNSSKVGINKLVELGKKDDGLIAHIESDLFLGVKPKSNDEKSFHYTFGLNADKKGLNGEFTNIVNYLESVSNHSKIFSAAYKNPVNQGKTDRATAFLNHPIVATLMELPENIANKAKDTLALAIAKRKTIGDFNVRYFQSNPFSHDVPTIAVKSKKFPEVKGYTEVFGDDSASPLSLDKYLQSEEFELNAKRTLEDEVRYLKNENELKAETKELREYIDKAFAKK